MLNFCYECVTEVLQAGSSHIATGGALQGKAPTILYQLLLEAASWKLEKLELRRCPQKSSTSWKLEAGYRPVPRQMGNYGSPARDELES